MPSLDLLSLVSLSYFRNIFKETGTGKQKTTFLSKYLVQQNYKRIFSKWQTSDLMWDTAITTYGIRNISCLNDLSMRSRSFNIFPISGCRWRNREKGAVRRNPNTEPARRLNSDTMSKIYFSYFKTYISKLLKLQVSKYHLFLVDFLSIFFANTRKFSHQWSSLDRITQLSVLKGSSYSVTKDSPSFESFSPILSHVTLD